MATKSVKRYSGEDDESLVETSPVYMASATGVDLPPMEEEKAAPAKAKIVTKEELAKSGLSLRDYLNKQQGLTRRGDTKSKVEEAVTKRTVPTSSPSRSKMLTRMRESDKNITGVRDTPSTPSAPRSVTKINPEDFRGGRMKGMGGDSGFAKGGSVGSASKRADGCALRGKTRA